MKSQIIKLLTSECKSNIIGFLTDEYVEKIENTEDTEAVYKAFCHDKRLSNNEKSDNAKLLNRSYSSERLNVFWAGFETALMLITGK